jgi:nickel/cobalt transporter (NicO) family protein
LRRIGLRAGVLALTAGCIVAIAGAPASAHPLGNFTINTAAAVSVRSGGVAVAYVLDMAEIPAFQTVQQIDRDGDGAASPAEADAYARPECAALSAELSLRWGSGRIGLHPVSHTITFPPGVGGLSTLRLECGFEGSAALSKGTHVRVDDSNFAGRRGWHEITVVGSAADVPAVSPSAMLTAYPKDLLRSPLDVRTATITIGASPLAASDSAQRAAPTVPRAGIDRATEWFTSLIGHRTVTSGFAALAILAAVALGALHAFAPGHGKTAFAATLVAEKGTRRDVLVLAGTVTVTHTAGVVALGLLLAASGTAATDRLYPWLGVASGLLVAAVGAGLLRRWIRARRASGEHHDHAHPHTTVIRPRSLVALGLAGGLSPSPSALLVLLASISLGRRGSACRSSSPTAPGWR